MTGNELKAIRRRLGLSLVEFGLAVGYSGNPNTIKVTLRRYESGKRAIPPDLAEKIAMIGSRED